MSSRWTIPARGRPARVVVRFGCRGIVRRRPGRFVAVAETACRPLAGFEDLGFGHPARGRFHRGRDRARHLDLRRTRPIAVERARQQPAFAEDRVELVDTLAAQLESAFGRTNAPGGRRVTP
ncbi:hypothetical protein KPA97_15095, partial [Burkholderia cenocepacia]|nr:hypothetical protein [Burkholderia cenocepacia]